MDKPTKMIAHSLGVDVSIIEEIALELGSESKVYVSESMLPSIYEKMKQRGIYGVGSGNKINPVRGRKVSFSVSLFLDQIEKLEYLSDGGNVSGYLQSLIDRTYEAAKK